MKKVLGLSLISLLVLTGCEKSVVCKGTVEEDGINANIEVKGILENDKISKASATMTFSDETASQSVCGMLALVNSFATDSEKINYECNGKTVKLENYLQMASEEEKKDSYTKDEFIKLMEEEKLTCK